MNKKALFLYRFVAFRKHLNQKQGDWAGLVERGRATFSRAENGNGPLWVDYLLDIAEAHNIHPADFFCYDPEIGRVEYPTEAVHLQKIAQLEKTILHLLASVARLEQSRL